MRAITGKESHSTADSKQQARLRRPQRGFVLFGPTAAHALCCAIQWLLVDFLNLSRMQQVFWVLTSWLCLLSSTLSLMVLM